MVQFKIDGKEMVKKTVGRHGTGGIVYCPKAWVGKQVIVILEGE
jgi:putative transposon-encoded protein